MLRKVAVRVEGEGRRLEQKAKYMIEHQLREEHLVRVERRKTTRSASKGVNWYVNHNMKLVAR